MNGEDNDTRACFLVICEDRPGIVAAVSGLLFSHGANITALDQHSTGPQKGMFFMRLEFDAAHLDVPLEALEAEFGAKIAGRFGMDWRLRRFAHRPKVGVLVSKHEHALLDLLWAARRGELAADIALVISNHADLRDAVAWFGIPFEHVPVEPGSTASAEKRMLELVAGRVDLLVLARYMRILSGDFTRRFPNRIINIHHSFLPAFKGADPYGQASERGVKLIGATAHYVVEELDAGPIIEQAVRPVSHRQTIQELRTLGREIESQVLTRAVKLHVEERILVDGHKTIVF